MPRRLRSDEAQGRKRHSTLKYDISWGILTSDMSFRVRAQDVSNVLASRKAFGVDRRVAAPEVLDGH